MPEGPEVKRMADQLKAFVQGKLLFSTTVVGGRYLNKPFETPPRLSVKDVYAKGKFLCWEFTEDWFLWATMGMSGTWRIQDHLSLYPHDAVRFELYQEALPDKFFAGYVFFNDIRHFGSLKFVKGLKLHQNKLESLGVDFLQQTPDTIPGHVSDCQAEILSERLKKRPKLQNQPISVILMDQGVFAGVGNYLRAEALYKSKISPWRLLKNVSEDEFETLCRETHRVMWTSYKYGGATIATYRDVQGNKGAYSDRFEVYGRKSDPFGNSVIKELTPDQRAIHWVPEVQK